MEKFKLILESVLKKYVLIGISLKLYYVFVIQNLFLKLYKIMEMMIINFKMF